MRTLLVAVFALCVCIGPVSASGQTVTTSGSAADLGLGLTVNWAVKLEGGRRGFLVYVTYVDAYVVLVQHPSKSGPQGSIPSPGLCRENMFRPSPSEPWGLPHGPQPYDADHDGDDDLVIQSYAWPYTWSVINLDVVHCR